MSDKIVICRCGHPARLHSDYWGRCGECECKLSTSEVIGIDHDMQFQHSVSPDASDEQSSRLLSALETIARECNCPAHQIAVDTLEMHKAWLTTRKDAR